MPRILALGLFAALGCIFLRAGWQFYDDPALFSAELTMRTGISLFDLALPSLLVIGGFAIAAVGFWDGINRLSDALVIPLGAAEMLLGIAFFTNKEGTIATLDAWFPDGRAVMMLAVMLALMALPPFYVAYKLATERYYPGKKPKAQNQNFVGTAL